MFRGGLNLKLRDDHPDFAALVLGNYLLGGSSDARLARRIREKEGLSYSVGSWLNIGAQDEAGDFGVYAIYAPQNRARLEAAIRQEIARALERGVRAGGVRGRPPRAAPGAPGRAELRRALAGRLASYSVIGRTFKWDEAFEQQLAALTPAQVRDALRRHLDPSKLTLVKAGDFTRVAGKAD